MSYQFEENINKTGKSGLTRSRATYANGKRELIFEVVGFCDEQVADVVIELEDDLRISEEELSEANDELDNYERDDSNDIDKMSVEEIILKLKTRITGNKVCGLLEVQKIAEYFKQL